MIRKAAIVVLLSLLVVFAGCTGLQGADGATPTTTDAVSSATDAGDPDAGTTETGDVELVDNRTAALRAAGSYTSVWKMEVTSDGEPAGVTSYTHAVDYANERSSFSMLQQNGEEVSSDVETFQAEGMTYARYGSGEDATYSAGEAPFEPDRTLFSVRSHVTDADDLAPFASAGRETFDGVTVTRYERTDRPAWVAAGASDEEFVWTEFTYTVLVDDDGLVRSDSWRGTGVDEDDVEHTMEFSFSLTDVGSTVIEDPDWLEMARGGDEA